MSDAGQAPLPPPARRRHSTALSAAAALLLVGGGAAVAVGAANQTADPPQPRPAAAAPTDTRAEAPAPGPATTAGKTTPAGKRIRPVGIRIPSIGVRSSLITVGLNPDNTLAVPQPGKDYDKAAWFTGSPTPGQVGPAVIEGHVDGKANGPSVFYRLGALKPGRTVTVRRADGSNVSFVVDVVRSYPKNRFPTLAVYGNTTRPELRLITCGGPFDRNRKGGGYLNNIVVFAHQT